MESIALSFKRVHFIFAFWTYLQYSIADQYLLPHYTASSGALTHILLDDVGQVIVGGTNGIFRFLPDLDLKEKISTNIPSECSETTCENTSEDNFVSIFIFYPYKQENHILFCGTMEYGSCILFNTANLSDNIPIGHYEPNTSSAHFLGSKTSAQAVVANVTESGNKQIRIFSAMEYDGRPKNKFPKVFSVRKLDEKYNELYYAQYYTEKYITLKDELFNKSVLEFKYGFHVNGYTYFLWNTKGQTAHAQISEVCSDDFDYRSYVESGLSCDGYVNIESAYLLEDDDAPTLYVAFSSYKHPGSVLCKYSINDLREAFRRIQAKCYYEGIGSAPEWIESAPAACKDKKPLDTKFDCGRHHENTRIRSVSPLEIDKVGWDQGVITSMVAATEDDTMVFYCGCKDGTLKKYMYLNGHYGLLELYSLKVTDGSQVNDKMAVDSLRKHLYFTSSNTISLLRTDNCSLHTSCVSCLSDTMPCQWCIDSSSSGRCTATDTACNYSRTTYCDPKIDSVNPLTGPVAGGTRLTLNGIFGTPSAGVHRITVGKECVLHNESNYRLECVTTNAGGPRDVEIKLLVVLNTNMSIPVPVYGSSSFNSKYVYQEPKLTSVAPVRISSTGRPIMVISGEKLDIGATRQCRINASDTDIVRETSTEVTIALKPETRTIGSASLYYSIDNATMSARIEIIQPPVIETVSPKYSIQSGGIILTVSGLRLDGMGKFLQSCYMCSGVSCEENSNRVSSDCQIKNETTILCRSPSLQSTESSTYPTVVQFCVKNRFGPVYLDQNDFNGTLLNVFEDPEIANFTETLIIKSRNTSIQIQGHGFKWIESHEIKISVGPVNCPVTGVNDAFINCSLDILEDQAFDNEAVLVQMGNIKQYVGHVVYLKTLPQREAVPYSTTGGTEVGVAVISVVGGLVVVAVFMLIIMKWQRLGPFKRERAEQYNVVYRNGGSDILTLDGLSENHATDISQNRQNAYQEQTFRKPALADEDYETCTEQLLPVVDENIKLTLENQRLLIDRDTIVLGEILGQGHFGCVYKAYLQTPGEKGEQIVAAKTLHRKNPKDLDINMFLKEALIMKDFQHRHVMKLVGICIGNDQLPLVILPFMENGDLLTYLRDPKNVPTVKDLVTFGVDIANGMCYLAELKFVHRDLAARNCMMGENYIVKVADFGLSRDVYEKEYYSSCDKTTKLPVKWMAPESLEFGMYSSKSDVWSYGVVLWELLTRGVNPYPEVDNWDILKYLKMGRRMSQPSFCPEEMYSIMQRCWSWESADRPSFGELTVEIPALIRQLEHPAGERGNKINIETTYVNFRNN